MLPPKAENSFQASTIGADSGLRGSFSGIFPYCSSKLSWSGARGGAGDFLHPPTRHRTKRSPNNFCIGECTKIKKGYICPQQELTALSCKNPFSSSAHAARSALN